MSAITGQIMLTRNDCYIRNQKMTPKGIVVHSTGANNPYVKRYVQPNQFNIGSNVYNNDWNRGGLDVAVHAFIGKDNDGNIVCIQTLPFDICCWGVGSGSKGSYNYNPAYIQFEICEDDLTSKDYCTKTYNKAVALCAELCRKYSISVDNIVGHYEAHQRGYGSDHADPRHWWSKHGLTMDGFRKAVKAKLESSAEKPAAVKITSASKLRSYAYCGGNSKILKSLAKGTEVTYNFDDGCGWSCITVGKQKGYVQNTRLNKSGLSAYPKKTVTADVLNVRTASSLSGKIIGKVKNGAKLTVRYVIESGTGAGWAEVAYPKSTDVAYVKDSYLK